MIAQPTCRAPLAWRDTAAGLVSLALRLADHARLVGLTVDRIETSRMTSSHSRYLRLRDPWGARWLLRVSDHARRASADRHERPHHDLVTTDERCSEAGARAWLDRVAYGMEDWADPMAGVRQPRQARMGRRQ